MSHDESDDPVPDSELEDELEGDHESEVESRSRSGSADDGEDEDDLEAIRELARELSFCDDEDVLRRCLEKAERLDTAIADEPPGWEPGQSRGHLADDEYNALLSVYDTPRTETESGPLAGTTLAIKDNIAVEGLAMTAGLGEHSFVPDYDAVLVERLLAAGGSIVGKANMDALALGPEGVWSERGQVRNSIDDERVPGGSSSGSAVAVATGLVDAAIGTDAGGSIRKPAAYNELVGVKPSRGAVPSDGKVTCATTLGSIGPITKTVADAAAVLETIAGPDRRDPNSAHVDLGPLGETVDDPLSCTIGVPDSFLECADEPVRDVLETLADDVADQTDCAVREVSLDNDIASISSYLSGAEFGWLLRQGAVDHGGNVASDATWNALFESLREDGLNEHVTLRKLPSAFLDETADGLPYVTAHRKMVEYGETVDAVFEDVDLLLTPTVPALAPRLDEDIETLPRNLSINCTPFNLAGTPAVAVPAGRADGLPVSAQITAPLFEDGRALQGARVLERVRTSQH